MDNQQSIRRLDAKQALLDLPAELDALTVQRCIEAIGMVPEAKRTPIVRCKDCRSFNSYPMPGKGWCRALHRVTTPDWYCAGGAEDG